MLAVNCREAELAQSRMRTPEAPTPGDCTSRVRCPLTEVQGPTSLHSGGPPCCSSLRGATDVPLLTYLGCMTWQLAHSQPGSETATFLGAQHTSDDGEGYKAAAIGRSQVWCESACRPASKRLILEPHWSRWTPHVVVTTTLSSSPLSSAASLTASPRLLLITNLLTSPGASLHPQGFTIYSPALLLACISKDRFFARRASPG